jgi:hypothetical protein
MDPTALGETDGPDVASIYHLSRLRFAAESAVVEREHSEAH